MEQAILEGILIAPDIVLEELKRKEDDLFKWAKNQKELFHPLDVEIQIIQAEIINNYPRLIDSKKNRSMCDPWVIALAKHLNCEVVSEEKRSGKEEKPKMPDVCDRLSIECITIADLIEKLKWSF